MGKHTHKLFLTLLFLVTFILSGCSEKTPIINNIDEREANEIVVFLASKGINAEKQAAPTSGAAGGGSVVSLWNIYVDPSQLTEAMSILNRNGLPRKQGTNLLDLFSESGLVPTDMQQKIRFQAGLAQQIANTIRQIDGVIDATVQLSFPQDEGTQPITASVYVKHQGVLDNPNSQLVTKIKQLVAGSVAGLKLENVTVISDRSRFTDVTITSENQMTPEEEREYVSIWGVWVARDSTFLFRFIFFSFSLIILILIIAIAWLLWRCLPLLEKEGGISYLWEISLTPKEKIEASKEDVTPPEIPEEK